ncbi:nuclear transport factor 2 family protein [Pseudomonas aeruginosa]|nr:nuclear transport factor 2 family protein [Pseudomonas aeruginosa]
MNAKEILVHSLRLLENGDARGWCDLFHPEGVLEFPLRPAGLEDPLRGPRNHLGAHAPVSRAPDRALHRRAVLRDRRTPTWPSANSMATAWPPFPGGKLAQDYISVLRTRDGQILLYRDFWNPLRHLEALGGVEAAAKIVQGSLSHAARRRGLRPGQLPARGRAQQRHARRRAGHFRRLDQQPHRRAPAAYRRRPRQRRPGPAGGLRRARLGGAGASRRGGAGNQHRRLLLPGHRAQGRGAPGVWSARSRSTCPPPAPASSTAWPASAR